MKYILLVVFMFSATPLAWPGEDSQATLASWYSSADACGPKTNNHKGCPTASGKGLYALEREKVLFAASNDYKIGSTLKVSNRRTGKSVVVRVWDRGSFDRKYGRTIDLGKLAFSRIEDTKRGLVEVNIEKIG